MTAWRVAAEAPVVEEQRFEEQWQLPVRHFSPSSLNMLQRCPEQYRQRYILGRKERPGVALVLGSANHATHEHNFTQKIESGVDLPTKEVVEYYHDEALPKQVEKDGGVDHILWDTKGKTSVDDLHQVGGKMVEVYREQVAPRVQPTALETECWHTVTGVPKKLFGFIDVETADDLTIDMKTSSKKVTTLKGGWRLQGRIYQLFRPRPVAWHVITSTKEPAVWTPLEAEGLLQTFSAAQNLATEQIVRGLAWHANDLYARFGPDEPWPMTGVTNEHCGWCGFRKYCLAWQGVS